MRERRSRLRAATDVAAGASVEDPLMTETLLVATDGSACAAGAIEAALRLARQTGARVTFVHADDRLAEALFELETIDLPTAEQVAARDEVLAVAARLARQAGVQAELRVIGAEGDTGDLAASLAGMADGIGAAMIVVGSRGRGAFTGALLGSVSHNLIKYSRVPVLISPAPHDESD